MSQHGKEGQQACTAAQKAVIEKVVDYAKLSSQGVMLNANDLQLGDKGLAYLCDVLKHRESVIGWSPIRLELKNNGITDQGIIVFCDVLSSSGIKIAALSLQQNALTEQCTKVLSQFVSNHPNLLKITLCPQSSYASAAWAAKIENLASNRHAKLSTEPTRAQRQHVEVLIKQLLADKLPTLLDFSQVLSVTSHFLTLARKGGVGFGIVRWLRRHRSDEMFEQALLAYEKIICDIHTAYQSYQTDGGLESYNQAVEALSALDAVGCQYLDAGSSQFHKKMRALILQLQANFAVQPVSHVKVASKIVQRLEEKNKKQKAQLKTKKIEIEEVKVQLLKAKKQRDAHKQVSKLLAVRGVQYEKEIKTLRKESAADRKALSEFKTEMSDKMSVMEAKMKQVMNAIDPSVAAKQKTLFSAQSSSSKRAVLFAGNAQAKTQVTSSISLVRDEALQPRT